MQEAECIPWSGNTYPTKEKMLLVDAKDKGDDLQVCSLRTKDGGFVPGKRNSIVDNMLNVITKLWKFTGQSDTKCTRQPAEQYTLAKEEPGAKRTPPITATMPIFETGKDGTGRLTVPLGYDTTADDVAMTPAGVYVEDTTKPSSERNCARSSGLRKRRKHQSKGAHDTVTGCGEGGVKGAGGKNRKDKKRHNLRMDIVNDLSMDDWHGYDYRDAEFEDAIGSTSMSQCYLSSSFSPSSMESVSSFHDALQDALVMEACMHESFGAAPSSSPVAAVPVIPTAHQPDTTVLRRNSTTNSAAPTVAAMCASANCDISPDRSGFVVFTEYDVFATPSASPARRRPPARSLCKAIAYVWRRSRSNDDEEDEEEDNSDDDEDDNSDDVSDDGEYCFENDNDEDDDSVVFCEEFDENDDSNSSSGFEERKVHFNMNPVVHVMRTWDFAYRQARKGDWEMAARDRERFRKRIDDLEPVLGPALQSTVRDKIYTERFSNFDAPDCSARKTDSPNSFDLNLI